MAEPSPAAWGRGPNGVATRSHPVGPGLPLPSAVVRLAHGCPCPVLPPSRPRCRPRAGGRGIARRGLHRPGSSRRNGPALFNRSSHWRSISSPNRLLSSTDIPLSHRANHRPQPRLVPASPACHRPRARSPCTLSPAPSLGCSLVPSRAALNMLSCAILPCAILPMPS